MPTPLAHVPADGSRILGPFKPTNTIVHAHHGFSYTFALHNGFLIRPSCGNDRWEYIIPWTEAVQDQETGEWHGPDPERDAYIAALIVVLQTTERKQS